jgi:hypothetical protein
MSNAQTARRQNNAAPHSVVISATHENVFCLQISSFIQMTINQLA